MTYNVPLARGWRDRQAKAQNRNGDAEKARIAEERARHYEAIQLEAQVQAAADAERRARARCSCPACDGDGTVTVDLAERIIRAMDRLPADSKPDQFRLQILHALSAGEQYHGNRALRPSVDLHHPRRADVSPVDGPADVSPQAAPRRKVKAAAPPPTPPWLDHDAEEEM